MKPAVTSAPSRYPKAAKEFSQEAHSSAPAGESHAATTAARNPDYTIYKANAKCSGAAMRLSLNVAKAAIFVDAALQNGERQFAWEEKITMKWNVFDIGAILATFETSLPEAKLFHQSEKASSTCHLIASENPERAPFMITLTRQATVDRSLKKVTLPISHAEASVLRSLLARACYQIAGW